MAGGAAGCGGEESLLGVGVLVGQHVELLWHARPCCEPIEGSWRLSTDLNGLWIKPMPCCLFILEAFWGQKHPFNGCSFSFSLGSVAPCTPWLCDADIQWVYTDFLKGQQLLCFGKFALVLFVEMFSALYEQCGEMPWAMWLSMVRHPALRLTFKKDAANTHLL